jgi:hypothetical protein
MTSITLDPTTSPLTATRREKIAAGLAIPLGLMTFTGGIIFWEWSALTWMAMIAVGMGASYLWNASRVLRGDAAGVRPVTLTAYVHVAFTISKLVIWQETEAAPFGVVAIAIALLLRGRAPRSRVRPGA